ncbi:MAG TPA: nuclear transport factor 2 family protein [Mesorhizobium sp.]|uniref:YybH family protein n=1 Tax=Mesorhizobium sp. TaxID=1871066 RepID=UPI002DDC9F23|nr:nuclear transport factor 2 family protein [Mesorhizobium sp.]HEV2502601.1 nuclear transport factor 2 family protein [Mesorhizobium sp.]
MSDELVADNEAQIRQQIEAWAAAVRRKDMAAILRDHADDFVMFDVPPPLSCTGLEAYRATWPLFFEASPTPPVFDIRELDITAGSDVAFAVALMRCVVIENGQASDLDFRLTIGLRKIGGRWLFVHEHHSIPAVS